MIDLLNTASLKHIVLEQDALSKLPPFVQTSGYKHVLIVADCNTYEAAGRAVEAELMSTSCEVQCCLIQPDPTGDCIADERSIVELLLAVTPGHTDCLIATGSGTIHDIVRFVASKTSLPFLSVPTAPSVDGFTSSGAPLIIRGMKITIPAAVPQAIFADLNILTRAPRELIAAGFGDMIGKFTSLFDWRFSSLTAQEPYDENIAQITEQALEACVTHVEDIGNRTVDGIRVLMNSLIESGVAMLLFGQSHPASGAEHHLSHYWEMIYLQRGNKALLHGAKVGVACAEISQLYHDAVDHALHPWKELEGLRPFSDQVRNRLAAVPSAPEIRRLLTIAGGPSTLEELGIDNDLFTASLREAHKLRNRHTLLKFLNEA